MTDSHSNNSHNRKRRRKKKKSNALLKVLLVIAAVVAIGYFAVGAIADRMYVKGEEVDEDIRTAAELQGDVMHILVCGIDWEEDRTSANTDVIMYVTLDIKGKKVSAFQIPRDTYIGDDVKTGGSGKINGVYGKNGNKNPIMDLAKTVNDKLGLPVDHYATLDMEAFIKMVDGIDGGLDMYVPFEIVLKDKNTGKTETIIPEAGWYKVSGELAEQIVRNRNYPNRDIQRLEVQKYFYASVIKYFMENTSVSDFIKIMSRFTTHLTTDMHWTEIASIAQFGLSLDYADMTIVKPSLHGYDVIKEGKTSATNILVAEGENWARLLNEYCRPYSDDISAADLKIPTQPPKGEIVRDHSVTQSTITTIGDLLQSAK